MSQRVLFICFQVIVGSFLKAGVGEKKADFRGLWKWWKWKFLDTQEWHCCSGTLDCHNAFALLVRPPTEQANVLLSFQMTSEELPKADWLKMLCRHVANTICKADAVSFPTYVTCAVQSGWPHLHDKPIRGTREPLVLFKWRYLGEFLKILSTWNNLWVPDSHMVLFNLLALVAAVQWEALGTYNALCDFFFIFYFCRCFFF